MGINKTEQLCETHKYTTLYKNKLHKAQTSVDSFLKNNTGQVWVSWSGGKDSTAALLITLRSSPNIPVVFFNSGLEFPENLHYINTLKASLNINLVEILPKKSALEVLQESGAWDNNVHGNSTISDNYFHRTLITEPHIEACHRFGNFNITGLRAEESQGRRILLSKNMGIYQKSFTQEKPNVSREGERKENRMGGDESSTSLCPLWNWSWLDVFTFLYDNNIPKNPTYETFDKLKVPPEHQRVGLFFDGNALEMGRATHLKNGWPEMWEILKQALPNINT